MLSTVVEDLYVTSLFCIIDKTYFDNIIKTRPSTHDIFRLRSAHLFDIIAVKCNAIMRRHQTREKRVIDLIDD